MTRSTIGKPPAENTVATYMIHDDGTPCEIPPPPNGDHTGLAGAGGGKSTISDMLKMYKSMLTSYRDQIQTKATSTSDSPFKQMEFIFSPKISINSSEVADESYVLGWVRSRFPAKLGLIGMNEAYLGHDKMPVIGEGSAGKIVFHHNGNLVGTLSSVHLLPETETAVLVMTNSLAFNDPTDWIGQLILETILDEKSPHDFIELARESRDASFKAYTDVISELEQGKTHVPPSQDLKNYEGDYYNQAHNFVLSIFQEDSQLRMMSQAMRDVMYTLEAYDGDTFYWPANREEELCKHKMFPWTWAGMHKIQFSQAGDDSVMVLAWQHDPGNKAEVFTKEAPRDGQHFTERKNEL